MEAIEKACKQCGSIYRRSSNIAYAKWSRRQYCSRTCSDKGRDASHLVMHQVKTGEHISTETEFTSARVEAEKNVNWKGDNASYAAKHMWIRYHFGTPSECEHCGTTENRMYHWANISREYKRDRSDWLRLCVPCHKKFDLGRKPCIQTQKCL